MNTTSGGFFKQKQLGIDDMTKLIECELERQCNILPDYENNVDDNKTYKIYPIPIQELMCDAVKQFKLASIYAKRIDEYLLGYYDNDEMFIKKVKDDIDELNN